METRTRRFAALRFSPATRRRRHQLRGLPLRHAPAKLLRRLSRHTAVVWAVPLRPTDGFCSPLPMTRPSAPGTPTRRGDRLPLRRGRRVGRMDPDGNYARARGASGSPAARNHGDKEMPSSWPASQFASALPGRTSCRSSSGPRLRTRPGIRDRANGSNHESHDVSSILPPEVEVATPRSAREPKKPLEGKPSARSPRRAPRHALSSSSTDDPIRGSRRLHDPATELGEVRRTLERRAGTRQARIGGSRRTATSARRSTPSTSPISTTNPRSRQALRPRHRESQLIPGPQAQLCAADAMPSVSAFRNQEFALFQAVESEGSPTACHRREILAGLSSPAADDPADVAVVFYSGHGVRDSEGIFLLPWTADPEDLLATAVADDQIRGPAGLPAVVSRCSTPAKPGPSRLTSRGSRRAHRRPRVATSVTGRLRRIVMQTPWDARSPENNKPVAAFTVVLDRGTLGARPDANKTAWSTAMSLDAYVTDRVKELTSGQQPRHRQPKSNRSLPAREALMRFRSVPSEYAALSIRLFWGFRSEPSASYS